jgi:hypothetical protein
MANSKGQHYTNLFWASSIGSTVAAHLSEKNYGTALKMVPFRVKIIRKTKVSYPLTAFSILQIRSTKIFKLGINIKKLSVWYINTYSLMSFFIGNQENFQTNLSVHSIDTRNKHHLQRPIANLSCFQKGASYSGIRIFSSLP